MNLREYLLNESLLRESSRWGNFTKFLELYMNEFNSKLKKKDEWEDFIIRFFYAIKKLGKIKYFVKHYNSVIEYFDIDDSWELSKNPDIADLKIGIDSIDDSDIEEFAMNITLEALQGVIDFDESLINKMPKQV